MDIGNRYVHFKLLELVNQLVTLTRLLSVAVEVRHGGPRETEGSRDPRRVTVGHPRRKNVHVNR